VAVACSVISPHAASGSGRSLSDPPSTKGSPPIPVLPAAAALPPDPWAAPLVAVSIDELGAQAGDIAAPATEASETKRNVREKRMASTPGAERCREQKEGGRAGRHRAPSTATRQRLAVLVARNRLEIIGKPCTMRFMKDRLLLASALSCIIGLSLF